MSFYHISVICVILVAIINVTTGCRTSCRTSLGELAPVRHKNETVIYDIQNDFSSLINKSLEYNIDPIWINKIKDNIQHIIKNNNTYNAEWSYLPFMNFIKNNLTIIFVKIKVYKKNSNTSTIKVEFIQFIQDVPQLEYEEYCNCECNSTFLFLCVNYLCNKCCVERKLNWNEIIIIKTKLINNFYETILESLVLKTEN